MLKNAFQMPEKSLMFLKYAMRTNRLVSYGTVEGIREVLHGMSVRATFESNMNMAIADLQENYPLFETEFKEFFEDMRKYVQEWLNDRGTVLQ